MARGGKVYLGVDVGTSGVRGIAIDSTGAVVAQASAPLPPPLAVDGGLRQDPELWWAPTARVIGDVAAAVPGHRIHALAIDGTSGTLLVTDARGAPLEPAGMYNDASAAALAPRIGEIAPPESGAHGATSPLTRLLLLQERQPGARHALHQADWLAARLTGRLGLSDDNNALKLGFDPVTRTWPEWLDRLGVRRELLPEVLTPGTAIGAMLPSVAASLGLAPGCMVVAGTTDGCASFLATGASQPGDGVSALGTTLTLKLLSDRPVFSPRHGVYSHRMGERWLVGGASNTGGKALLRYFTADRMAELTPRLRPDRPTGLHWHPLPAPGERFPVADPTLAFDPQPLPADEVALFQGLLEGIAEVEQRAYHLLSELGAPPLRSVRTVGGGAANLVWMDIRARLLGVPMLPPANLEAGYGTALLARGDA
ncbi:MAG: FGGY-family carbohydrate kinase [Geminicoccaceae bacterium]